LDLLRDRADEGPPDAESRMRAFLADNPQNKFGRHTYTWDATGLDLGAWRERAARYQEYFEVPTEPV
jgi:hypothetical protein